MGLFDELKALVTPQPEPGVPDGDWPPVTPGEDYYDDTSVQQIVVDQADPNGPYRPSVDHMIPYRGNAEHGVPYDGRTNVVIPLPQIDTVAPDETPSDPGPTTQLVEPIPVSVVSTPSPIARELRWNTVKFTVNNAMFKAVQIAPKRDARTRLRIQSTTGKNLIAHIQDGILNVGWPVVLGNPLEIITDQPVYAIGTDPADDTLYVLEEYPVSVEDVVT